MRWSWLLVVLVLVATATQAQEHQRIGSVESRDYRWLVGVDLVLTPLGSAWWSSSVTATTGLEVARTWSLRLGQGYDWYSLPLDRTVGGVWGPGSVSAGWMGEGWLGRWHLRLGADRFWEEAVAPTRARAEVGLQSVADPVILGASVQLAAPVGSPGGSVQLALSLQEVINDTTTWTLSASPRLDWVDGLAFWTVGVSWSWGWFQGDEGYSMGLSSGTEQPWSWSTSAERTWDFP